MVNVTRNMTLVRTRRFSRAGSDTNSVASLPAGSPLASASQKVSRTPYPYSLRCCKAAAHALAKLHECATFLSQTEVFFLQWKTVYIQHCPFSTGSAGPLRAPPRPFLQAVRPSDTEPVENGRAFRPPEPAPIFTRASKGQDLPQAVRLFGSIGASFKEHPPECLPPGYGP